MKTGRKPTHGMTKTSEYETWHSMHRRCNPKTKNNGHQRWYVANNITVCERWGKFENFLADMGPKPPGMTLERRKSSLGYSPENCRWATETEQKLNRSTTRW